MSFCKRCRKRLIKPESIVVGYGAVCFSKEFGKALYKRKNVVVKMKRVKMSELPLSTFNLVEWFGEK